MESIEYLFKKSFQLFYVTPFSKASKSRDELDNNMSPNFFHPTGPLRDLFFEVDPF